MILEFVITGYIVTTAASWIARTRNMIIAEELYGRDAVRRYYRLLWADFKAWAWD